MIDCGYVKDGFSFSKPLAITDDYYLGFCKQANPNYAYASPCFIDLRDNNGIHVMGYTLCSIDKSGLSMCIIDIDPHFLIDLNHKMMVVEGVDDI